MKMCWPLRSHREPMLTTSTASGSIRSGSMMRIVPTPAPASVAPAPAAAPAMQQVDVEQILNGMQQSSGQQLNWRTSIVDLMKLIGVDSDGEPLGECTGRRLLFGLFR